MPKRLEAVRCFMLDMDGTFYLGERILLGSLDFIRRLAETGRDYLFLTNNSSHGRALLCAAAGAHGPGCR